MPGVDIRIIGLFHYGNEHLVQQGTVIHFVAANWQGQLAFDAHHNAPNGPQVGRVAQTDIARLNISPTRYGIVTLVPLATVIQGVHSQIRRWSHCTGHSTIVTIYG